MDLGDVWLGRVQITDPETGAPADADVVQVLITLPSGAVSSPTPQRVSTGLYEAQLVTTQVGRHEVRWTSNGANAASWVDSFVVDNPALLPLVGMAEVRAHMGWVEPVSQAQRDRDEQARALAATATELVEDHCGRAFRRRTVVEAFAGGGSALLLTTLPAASVTSVVEDGATLDPSVWRLSSAGVLYRRAGTWGETTVTYTAGDAVAPGPVRLAVLRLIEHHWQHTQQAPHQGTTPGWDEGQPTTLQSALPYAVASLLDAYRSPGIA